MVIAVKFFASLKEQVGRDEARVEADEAATASDVWSKATEGRPMPGNVLVAVNMEYADAGQSVKDGDEVAFFPPVTGG